MSLVDVGGLLAVGPGRGPAFDLPGFHFSPIGAD